MKNENVDATSVLMCLAVWVMMALLFAPLELHAESAETAGAADSPTYAMGAGDVLEIITWKEPDFSREEVFIRIDGNISFPLIGDIRASGLTPEQLTELLEKELHKYIETPEITVTVKVPGSQKFYILGEVEKTGEYPLLKHTTVLQALAMAGGFSEWASKKNILLFRRENGNDTVFDINYRNIVKAKDFSQNIPLKADDVIIVP